MIILLFAILLPVLAMGAGRDTDDSGQVQQYSDSLDIETDSSLFVNESPTLKIRIERALATTGAFQDTVSVMIYAPGRRLAGFDLKFGLNSHLIQIEQVLPGLVFDSCGWEFFDGRTSRRAGQEGYPLQMWQAVALAETVPQGERPRCFGFDHEVSLLKIVVASPAGQLVDDTTLPIFFFWEDCTDNTLADASGDTLMFSRRIIDYFPTPDFEVDNRFPTRLGAPRACIVPSVRIPPIRAIDFHNGGVQFQLDLSPIDQPPWDSLRTVLLGMLQADSFGRLKLDSLEQVYAEDSPEVQQAWREQNVSDSLNQVKLRAMIVQFGWPDVDQIGGEAIQAAFLTIQHSHLDLMKQCLPTIREQYNSGKLPGQYLALLQDRVLMFEGKPQIYGTQIVSDEHTGQFRPHTIDRPALVDSLRADLGLPPLSDYLRQFGIEEFPKSPDSTR